MNKQFLRFFESDLDISGACRSFILAPTRRACLEETSRTKFEVKVRRRSMGKSFSRAQAIWPSHGLDNYQRGIEPTHWLRCACKRVMSIMLPCGRKSPMRKTDNVLRVSTYLSASFCCYPPPPSMLNRLQVSCNRSYDRVIRSVKRGPKLRYDPHLVQRSGQP